MDTRINSSTNNLVNMYAINDYSALNRIDSSESPYGVSAILEISATGRSVSNQSYQSMLSSLKFYTGPISGDLTTSLSQKAIKNFQRVYGLSITGSLDSNTINKLNSVYTFYCNTCKDADLQTLANNWNMDQLQKDNMALTWTFLRQGMSLTSIQAAGAMGNIMQESKFTPSNAYDSVYPGAYNPEYQYETDDQIAYGLIQWKHPVRKGLLLSEAQNMQLDVSDINAQFSCLRAEANSSDYCKDGWTNLGKSTTVASSTEVFKSQIEMCTDNTLQTRRNYAELIYNALA
ncbi:MAG: phage tail tip lysozyme [Butyrivibrio sp.]